MATQVRVYTVNPGTLQDFVAEWNSHVVPLRRLFGFEVEHAWASPDTDQLVWVLSYDGDDWEEAERAYYESAERAAIDPDPARHVVSPEAFFVDPVRLR